MAGFFRSLFRAGTKRQEPTLSRPVPPIEQMSVDEIVVYVQCMGETVSVKQCAPLLQRLYYIALYEHHVPEQHRNAALQLVETLNAEIEKGLSDNRDAIAALKRANNHVVENVRLYGIGSLGWKIAEESVLNADVVPYVMRPEHRHLVPDFLKTIRQEVVVQVRKEFVRHLILAGQYEAYNAVLILHGLAAKGDKAAAALFTVEEYMALLAIPNNYDAGRRVLVALGLLPDTSSARPFKQLPEIKAKVALLLKERSNEAKSDNRLENLPEEQKMALLLALNFLRIHLVHDNIRQIYGEEISNSLMDTYSDPTTKEAIEQFGNALRTLITMPPGTSVDLMLFDLVMVIGGIEAQSEDDWNRNRPFLNMGAEWLNQERVEFQYYLRFILRAMSDSVPQIKSATDEDTTALLEDWIGTEG